MATTETSLNYYENKCVSMKSECQCCSFLRSEVFYLINELKLLTEIIKILKEEAKYERLTVNYDQRTYSEC
jgi:hypothetical protein